MSSVRDLDKKILAEMSMVDVFFTMLKEGNKQERSFQELANEVIKLKGTPKDQKVEAMSRLYTEINIDGRFKALGDNVWGLRSWYPVDQAEEIVITDLKKKPKKKKKKKKAVIEEDDDFLDDDLEDLEDFDDDDDDIDDDDDDDDDDIDDIDDDDDVVDTDIDDDSDVELEVDDEAADLDDTDEDDENK